MPTVYTSQVICVVSIVSPIFSKGNFRLRRCVTYQDDCTGRKWPSKEMYSSLQ